MAAELRERLASVTDSLLDPAGTHGEWRDAALGLAALFEGIAPLAPNETPSSDHDETLLPSGKALSSVDAARCIADYERTRTFLTGVERAARRSIANRGHAHVLYAGTGPYAPLFVPLTTRFSPDELTVTLIDVHPSSVERVQTVIGVFQLDQYVEAVHCTDAATFEVKRSSFVDVLVVEAMQRALTREPQVAIVRNLARQVQSAVALVPERVTVSASITTPGSAAVGRRLGEVLVFDLGWARTAVGDTIPCARVPLSAGGLPGQSLTLETTITVHGDIEVGVRASGLTMPHHLPNVSIERAGSILEFDYHIGPDPGLSCTVR